jgi:hypothetical protein
MEVATGSLLNSTKASELIREQTGRKCSRQNLEKLCRQGRLPKSCVSLSPIRIDGDQVVDEYLGQIDTRQQVSELQTMKPPARQAAATKPPPLSILDTAPPAVPRHARRGDELPEYNESRARSEYEKANLLELERKTKEGLLLRREDVEQAWAQAVNITRTKLLGVPSTAKQRIPHLELEEVELLTTLIREALEELAAGEVTR